MCGEFLLIGKLLLDNLICLLGKFRFDYSDAVHDPMNMSIYSDIGRIIENGEHYFCGFYADSWECLKYF